MIIKKVKIKGFRSLKDVTIENLDEANIFYGENNSGKSNILWGLFHFFSPKRIEKTMVTQPDLALIGEKFIETKTEESRFDMGLVDDFENNFFKSCVDKIEYEIDILLKDEEFKHVMNNSKKDKKIVGKIQNPIFTISLTIQRENEKQAITTLQKIIVDKRIIYEHKEDQSSYYFGEAQIGGKEFIDNLLDIINNEFVILSSNRYLRPEKDIPIARLKFTAENFKSSLFNLSISEDMKEQDLFRKISQTFSDTFGFGEISFSRKLSSERVESGDLDILVNKDGFYLPIGYLGTGVQQLLILISNILYHNKKIFGIEEIELNLSPTSQQQILVKLGDLLDSKETIVEQLFLTSHSKHLCEGKNYYFVKAKNFETSVKFIADEKGDRESKLYFAPKLPDDLREKYDKMCSRHKL